MQLAEGSKHSAKVQHVGRDFAVVSLDDMAQLTVIQTRSHLNAVCLSESDRMKVGSTLAVEVIEACCQELQGLPLVSWQRMAAPHQASDAKGLRFGQTMQGTVKSVKPTAVTLTLAGGTVGSVHVSEVMDASQLCPGIFPTSSVKVGSVVSARVIGGREASSHRWATSGRFPCRFALNPSLSSALCLPDTCRSPTPGSPTPSLSSRWCPGTRLPLAGSSFQ